MKEGAPSIPDLLRLHQKNAKGRMINIAFLTDGKVQVSCQRGSSAAFNVVIKDDPVEALLEACGPRHRQSWDDHFKVKLTAPDPEPEDDEIEEGMNLI